MRAGDTRDRAARFEAGLREPARPFPTRACRCSFMILVSPSLIAFFKAAMILPISRSSTRWGISAPQADDTKIAAFLARILIHGPGKRLPPILSAPSRRQAVDALRQDGPRKTVVELPAPGFQHQLQRTAAVVDMSAQLRFRRQRRT